MYTCVCVCVCVCVCACACVCVYLYNLQVGKYFMIDVCVYYIIYIYIYDMYNVYVGTALMIVSKEEVLKDVLIHHASCYGKQVLDTIHTHKSIHKSGNGFLEMLRKTGL